VAQMENYNETFYSDYVQVWMACIDALHWEVFSRDERILNRLREVFPLSVHLTLKNSQGGYGKQIPNVTLGKPPGVISKMLAEATLLVARPLIWLVRLFDRLGRKK